MMAHIGCHGGCDQRHQEAWGVADGGGDATDDAGVLRRDVTSRRDRTCRQRCRPRGEGTPTREQYGRGADRLQDRIKRRFCQRGT